MAQVHACPGIDGGTLIEGQLMTVEVAGQTRRLKIRYCPWCQVTLGGLEARTIGRGTTSESIVVSGAIDFCLRCGIAVEGGNHGDYCRQCQDDSNSL